MLFSSPEFLFAFLPAFLFLYAACPARFRNTLLFAASLFFYFTTSGELTLVLILSVAVNYYLALWLQRGPLRARKLILAAGILINLLPLLYYKYARFFISAISDALRNWGLALTLPDINPILPIGISFFTFQAISYIADVYMVRTKPASNAIDFGMYHSCFPQLIAGPIVRYEEIEPQIYHRGMRLDDIYNGITQFCFGLGKKVILADNAGVVADKMFKLPLDSLDFSCAWIGVIAYTLQIYFDFSGYSDMAIGLGRVLGFSYPENFDQPYLSRSVTEFWRRWHMTLSRWFKDYVYIPLGGNRTSARRTLFNLFLVFFLCGLWHGAAYNFIVWGLYHGSLLVAERLARTWFKVQIPPLLGWAYTIVAVMVGWVFFRAESTSAAISYLGAMFSFGSVDLLSAPILSTLTADKITYLILAILCALVPYQWLTVHANRRYYFHPVLSVCSLGVAVLAIVMMSVNGFSPFIYFRF